MMLGNITVESWQAISAIVLLLLTWGLKFWQEFLKDRRDREADAARLTVLRDIKASNDGIRDGQIAQNGKLSAVVSVNEAHHTELIRVLQSTCRMTPVTQAQAERK